VSDKIATQIEESGHKKLTNRQREFCKYYVEGIYSNAECARKAGFSADTAHVYASKLLSGREHPQVLEYIKELREEKERRYGVTLIGQMKRLMNCRAVLKRPDNSLPQSTQRKSAPHWAA
jgi:phage terminase small subunit